jgi:hypothetical protein
MSSLNYLKTATFKVGRSVETKKRESNFNTARPHWDRMKCVLACETPYEKETEKLIHTMFSEFRDESANEMFSVPYPILSNYVESLSALNRNTIEAMCTFVTTINAEHKERRVDFAQLCAGVDLQRFNDPLAITNGHRIYTDDEQIAIAAINAGVKVYVDGEVDEKRVFNYYEHTDNIVHLKWGDVKKRIHEHVKKVQGVGKMSKPSPSKWMRIVYRLCDERGVQFSYDKNLQKHLKALL